MTTETLHYNINDGNDQAIVENSLIDSLPDTDHTAVVVMDDKDATLTLKVNNLPVQTIDNATRNTPHTLLIEGSKLIAGQNTVAIVVEDEEGASTSFNYSVVVNANTPVSDKCLAHMKFQGYAKSTVSYAELVNHLVEY